MYLVLPPHLSFRTKREVNGYVNESVAETNEFEEEEVALHIHMRGLCPMQKVSRKQKKSDCGVCTRKGGHNI